MSTAERVDRLRSLLADAGHEWFVCTNRSNIRWLTGFTGSSGLVLVAPDRLVLCTDGRYAIQGPAQLDGHGLAGVAEMAVGADPIDSALGITGTAPLALEADDVTWRIQSRFAEVTTVSATTGLVAGLRTIKDAAELASMRRAAALADSALAEVVPLLVPGTTERAIGLALDHAMRIAGGGPAYETIVASGPNAALPHARPTERALVDGDVVIVDVGCVVDGYRSDMTRSYGIGTPTDTVARMLDVVYRAQRAGVAAVAAGVPVADIDAACRAVIAESGWGDRFVHGTGHGVGLDIHEPPLLNARNDAVLAAGMVVTVEPGVYLEGLGGVRWEDLVLVTPDGCEELTTSPKVATSVAGTPPTTTGEGVGER